MTLVWGLIAVWSALIVYVIVDVRRVMRFNGRANAKLGLGLPTEVTERAVKINRFALVLLLIGSDLMLGRWLQ